MCDLKGGERNENTNRQGEADQLNVRRAFELIGQITASQYDCRVKLIKLERKKQFGNERAERREQATQART